MRHAIAIALLLLCGSASAEPTEAEKDAARILFTEAKELRDAGKVGAALERYQRAYDLAPTPITTLELARTHAMLGHLVEARRLYRAIEGIEKKPEESPKSLAARNEAKQLAGELDVRVPTIVLKVVPEEPITSATVDGKALDVAALAQPIALDPGKHVVSVRAKTEGTATVTLAEKERDRVVTIELPKPEAVAPKPAPVVVSPKPEPTPEVRSTWATTMKWVGLVAGGGGLVVGAGAGVLALSKASDVKSGCTGGVCPPSRRDDLDATRRWATVSTVGFGVAVVGATLFVIGLTSEPGNEKKQVAAPSIVPYASFDGLGLTGRF